MSKTSRRLNRNDACFNSSSSQIPSELDRHKGKVLISSGSEAKTVFRRFEFNLIFRNNGAKQHVRFLLFLIKNVIRVDVERFDQRSGNTEMN